MADCFELAKRCDSFLSPLFYTIQYMSCECLGLFCVLLALHSSQVVVTRGGELKSHTGATDNKLELLGCTEGAFKFSSLRNKTHFVGCSARGKGLDDTCVAEIAEVKEWIEEH